MHERDELEFLAGALDPDRRDLRDRLLGLATDAPWWRLSAAVLLQAAGVAAPAGQMCRDFVRTMGPPTDDLRRLRETFAQVALRLGEHDALQHYLRVCFNADVGILLTDDPRNQIAGTVDWSLRNGRTEFAFSEKLPTHNYFNTIVKHWAMELPLLLGYARHRRDIKGVVRLSLEDIGNRPGLAFCEHRREYFLLPDPFFVSSLAYRDVRASLDAGARPWAQRRPIAFWRGATTGWLNTAGKAIKHWRDLPRAVLCEIAQKGPAAKHYDVGLSLVTQLSAEAGEEVKASGLMRGHTPLGQMMDYKFQIDIDGNSSAWMALFTKLYSGSPVLKVQSPVNFRQWYYDRLKPWYNFVPVRRDMADLNAKLLWLQKNGDIAQAIGERGRALAIEMSIEREMLGAFATITAAFTQAAFVSRND